MRRERERLAGNLKSSRGPLDVCGERERDWLEILSLVEDHCVCVCLREKERVIKRQREIFLFSNGQWELVSIGEIKC